MKSFHYPKSIIRKNLPFSNDQFGFICRVQPRFNKVKGSTPEDKEGLSLFIALRLMQEPKWGDGVGG